MSLLPVTPEQLAPIATNNVGSFFYTAPKVFLHGTTRFAFVTSRVGTWRVRAFKRNNALGTWAQVDAGGGPAVCNGGVPGESPFACPTYVLDPSDTAKVLIAYPDSATAQIRLVRFDMTSGVEAFTGSTSAIAPTAHGTATIGSSHDDTGAKTCVAYRASTDSDLVLFQGEPEVILGQKYLRTYIVEYDRPSLTWSITPILVYGSGATSHFSPLGIVMGADGVAHLFFSEMVGSGPSSNYIWHACISSGLSVINPALAAVDVFLNNEPYIGYPRIRTVGAGPEEELLISYTSANPTPRARVARGDASTAPTWTDETVSTSNADSPIGDDFVTPTCAIGDDGFPYVFWIGVLNATFAYTLWYSKGGDVGAAWSTPLALLTLDPDAGDFMEFPCVSELRGIGFGIVAMDFDAAAYLSGAESNAYMEARYPSVGGGGYVSCGGQLIGPGAFVC